MYTVPRYLKTGEIIRGGKKKFLFPVEIGSALCNQTKLGNPCALDDFESIVVSYFRHAYAYAKPKRDWIWAEVHAFNKEICWPSWEYNT